MDAMKNRNCIRLLRWACERVAAPLCDGSGSRTYLSDRSYSLAGSLYRAAQPVADTGEREDVCTDQEE